MKTSEPMLVRDLVAWLLQQDQDYPVVLDGYEYGVDFLERSECRETSVEVDMDEFYNKYGGMHDVGFWPDGTCMIIPAVYLGRRDNQEDWDK